MQLFLAYICNVCYEPKRYGKKVFTFQTTCLTNHTSEAQCSPLASITAKHYNNTKRLCLYEFYNRNDNFLHNLILVIICMYCNRLIYNKQLANKVSFNLHKQFMVRQCFAKCILCRCLACDTLPSIFTIGCMKRSTRYLKVMVA